MDDEGTRGSDVISLVEFCPVVYDEIASRTDKWASGGIHNIPIAFFKNVGITTTIKTSMH